MADEEAIEYIVIYGEQDRKVISKPFNCSDKAIEWIKNHENSEFMAAVPYNPEFTKLIRKNLKQKLIPIIKSPENDNLEYVGSTNNCGNLFSSDCFDLSFWDVGDCTVLTLTAYTELFEQNCNQIYNNTYFGLTAADLVRNQGYLPNIECYIFPSVSKRIEFITLDEFKKLFKHKKEK
jgi:hypothetical protein